MLILADGDLVSDIVSAADDRRIRLVTLPTSPVIGLKRNIGCVMANGEIIAHWDDDDYSAPGRLVDQIDRLIQTGKSVTGYHPLKFTDGKRWWLYDNKVPHYSTGTSLCYRKDWWSRTRFVAVTPEMLAQGKSSTEDYLFQHQAACAGQLVVVPAGDMMYATIHRENTSPRNCPNGYCWTELVNA